MPELAKLEFCRLVLPLLCRTPMKQYLRNWGVSGLVILMLSFSAFAKLTGHPEVAKVMSGTLGFPATVISGIGLLEIACVLLYAIPRTAVLGAVLLTGYLGGAIAAHVRVGDAFISPLIGGGLVWLGIYLRDARVRALLPLISASR